MKEEYKIKLSFKDNTMDDMEVLGATKTKVIEVVLDNDDKEIVDSFINELGIDLFNQVVIEIDTIQEINKEDRRIRILSKLLEVMHIKKSYDNNWIKYVQQVIKKK
nr:hypothetical protein [uncultured Sphingobacterium sp.]